MSLSSQFGASNKATKSARITALVVTLLLLAGASAQPSALPSIQPEQARLTLTLPGVEQPTLGLLSFGERGPILTVTDRGLAQWWTWPQLLGVQVSQSNPPSQLSNPVTYTCAVLLPPARIIFGATDGKSYVHSAFSNLAPEVWPAHSGSVRVLSAIGENLLASGGDDGALLIWDIANGKLKVKWSAHSDWVSALAGHAKHKILASAGYDLAIRLWDIENGKLIQELPVRPAEQKPDAGIGHLLPICGALELSGDGKLLAAGFLDGTIRLYDVATGNLNRVLTGHTSQISAIIFHPTGQLLISASRDRTIRLWNVSTGQPYRVLEAHQSWVLSLALLDYGTRLVSVGIDGTLRIWDLRAPPK